MVIYHGLVLAKQDEHLWNFISIQGSHTIPTEHSDVYRVRTGYERVVAHRVTKTFAGIAQGKGKVTNVDYKILVKYQFPMGKVKRMGFGQT